MQVSPINQAVPMKMESKCSSCSKHLSDLLFEKNELYITDCGHIFDKICMKKIAHAAKCTCGKTIGKVARTCSNIWGNCAHNSDIHAQIPSSLQLSLGHGLTILITNCGHLVHAVCWIEFREAEKEVFWLGRCPECQQAITQVALFQVNPILHKDWTAREENFRGRQTELVLKDFLRDETPPPHKNVEKVKAIPKTASLLSIDAFEMI